MRPIVTFLASLAVVTGLVGTGNVSAQEDTLQIEHETLPDDLFGKRGSGSTGGASGLIEKPIRLVNKCSESVDVRLIYRNKEGNHKISTSLGAGQSGSTGVSALEKPIAKCTKSGGGSCSLSANSAASAFTVTATCR